MADDVKDGEGKVIHLRHPIEGGSEKGMIDRLVMRRGRFGDLRGLTLGAVALRQVATEDCMLIASRLSGIPVGIIERVDEDDYGDIMEVVMDFLSKSLRGGASG